MKQHILENAESKGENTTFGLQDLGESIRGYGEIKADNDTIKINNKEDKK